MFLCLFIGTGRMHGRCGGQETVWWTLSIFTRVLGMDQVSSGKCLPVEPSPWSGALFRVVLPT